MLSSSGRPLETKVASEERSGMMIDPQGALAAQDDGKKAEISNDDQNHYDDQWKILK